MLKKVIVKQQDKRDCGICCIQSVIKYYDGYVSLEKIREDTQTSKRGTSAFHMIETLKKYGFDCYGAKIQKENLKKERFPLPAIVHVVLDNGLNHYMVLYEVRKEKVILMDPSSGKKIMNITDFFWIWSEVVVLLYPKNSIICMPKETPLIFIILQYLGKEKAKIIKVILLQTLTYMLTILGSFYLKLEISQLNQVKNQILIFGLFTIMLVLRFIGNRAVMIEERNINKNLELSHTTSLIEHLVKIPLKIFNSRESSDYLTRIWEQTNLKRYYTEILKNSVIATITIVLSLIFLFFLNQTFFIYFIIIAIIYFISQITFQKACDCYEKESIEEQNKFAIKMMSHIENTDNYTFLNLKNQQQEKMEHDLIIFLKSRYQREKFYQKYEQFHTSIKEGSSFLFLTIGIIFLNKNKIQLIDFFLIQEIGMYLLNGIEEIIHLLPETRYLQYVFRKSNNFLEIEKELNPKKKEQFQFGNLVFDNVTFSYNQYNYVLKDLSFEIPKGNHVLLMGNSGCGKSTLCKIMTRIQNQSYGTIKIAQINIEDYNPQTVREHIIYLPQKSKLIGGTIKENIIMSRAFNLQKFTKICEICHINEIVDKKPLRYETVIAEQDNNLSGGELQRIMLARTLFSNADIFLFDESLSEVDEKLEKEIIKEIRIFLEGKTIIYISHKNHKKLFDKMIELEECHERVFTN